MKINLGNDSKIISVKQFFYLIYNYLYLQYNIIISREQYSLSIERFEFVLQFDINPSVRIVGYLLRR